jgi:hypothetical protein
VIGYPEEDTPERLYFDTQVGLLLRCAAYLATAAGPSPSEVDYDDYRDVGGGLRMPFVVRMNPASLHPELGTTSTFRVERVPMGVPVDEMTFARPSPKPRPPAPRAGP